MFYKMHEYPLTKQIIEISEKYAKEHNSKNVLKINLVVGEYSGVVADSIMLYFDIISSGTLCENASLNIKKIKPLLKCKKCGYFFKRKPFTFSCTKKGCNGEGEPTEIGREFYISSIEVDL